VFVFVENQCPVFLQEARGHAVARRDLVGISRLVDEVAAELAAEALGNVLLRYQAEFHQDGPDPLPVVLFALQVQRTIDVVAFEFASVDQQPAQRGSLMSAYGFESRRPDFNCG